MHIDLAFSPPLPRQSQTAPPVALITGSTSGIGAAIARRLSNDGFSVVLHSRSSVETGRALARELGSAIYVQANLADDADRIRLIREAVTAWGRFEVLFNNASISRVIPHANLAAATPEVWAELHEVNVVAPFCLIAEAETALRDAAQRGRPGCVINISSHAGVRPKGASIPYLSTKAALNHMTRLLAILLAPDIRVCRCSRVGGHAIDRRLDAGAGALENKSPNAAVSQSGRHCSGGCDAGRFRLSNWRILLSDGGLNFT